MADVGGAASGAPLPERSASPSAPVRRVSVPALPLPAAEERSVSGINSPRAGAAVPKSRSEALLSLLDDPESPPAAQPGRAHDSGASSPPSGEADGSPDDAGGAGGAAGKGSEAPAAPGAASRLALPSFPSLLAFATAGGGSEPEENEAERNARRLQPESKKWRDFFGLPDTENLLDDSFICALYKKIMHQGRLYVFDSFICFYSNVFGVERRKIIALQNVTQIVKARTALVVPNAIEVVTLDGKRDFFTSFITHDRAYRLMLSAWAAKSPFAEVFFAQRAAAEAEAEAAKVAAAEAKAAAEREKAEKTAADKAAREAAAREAAVRDAAAREAAAAAAAAANAANAANPAPPVAPAVAAAAASIGASIADALDFLDFRRAASGGDASSGGVKSGGDAEDESDEDPLDAADAADDDDDMIQAGATASVSPPPAPRGRTAMARRATAPADLPSAPAAAALPLSPVAGASPSPARPPAEDLAASASPQAERPRGPHHARMFSDASDGVPEALRATPRRAAVPRRLSAADLLELDAPDTPAEPPPPVPAWPKAMKQVLEMDIDASLEALVEAVWSDAAAAEGAFARSVYASRQETEVHITPWGAARGGGFQRDVTFRAPVKGASRSFGPKSTYCHQTQQCRRYGPPAFVLRSSQVMNDIPYGDYFRVEMRWDLRAVGPGRVSVRVGVEVPFSKSTFLRGTIESTTMSETTEMARDWVAAMKRQVAAVAEAAAEEEAAVARSPSPAAATPGAEVSLGDGGSVLRRIQSLERTVTPRPAQLLTPPPGTPRSVASRRDLDDDAAFGDAKAAGGVAGLALAPAWLLALCAAALLLLAFMAGSARAGSAGGAHLSAAALQEQRAAMLLAAAHVQPHVAWAPPRPATTAAAIEADWLAAMPTEPPSWETRAAALREEAALYERRLGYLRAELAYAEAKAKAPPHAPQPQQQQQQPREHAA